MLLTSVIETIGSTPVVALNHPLVPPGKKLLLKLEQFNPNHSVKDRTAIGLISAAMTTGQLKPGGTLIESTSGNLGKSLAMLGAIMGFHVIVVVDPKVSASALNWFYAYGAEVLFVNEPDASGGYQQARIDKVKALVNTHPEYYWCNQYENPNNPIYHAASTAVELLEHEYDLLVGCVSTGGHLSGVASGLKQRRPKLMVAACDVEGSAVLQETFAPYLLNGVGLGWRSSNTHIEMFDHIVIASDQTAMSMCRLLARECGLLTGGSSGLVVYAALKLLRSTDATTALAILPDSGTHYLETIYDNRWLEEHGITLLTADEMFAH